MLFDDKQSGKKKALEDVGGGSDEQVVVSRGDLRGLLSIFLSKSDSDSL